MNPRIRLVSFDLLHTLIAPRLPIEVQYAEVFQPYLGSLDPLSIRSAFRTAFRNVSSTSAGRTLAGQDPTRWWTEVIHQTALGAGANPKAIEDSLSSIVPRLMKRFSSREGYKVFGDTIDTLNRLNAEGIRTAVVSNADDRMCTLATFSGRDSNGLKNMVDDVLQDLGFPTYVKPILICDGSGLSKPDPAIYAQLLQRVNSELERPIRANECLHVGDELDSDYDGARNVGMEALLLRRPGAEEGPRNGDVVNSSVAVVESLQQVLDRVLR